MSRATRICALAVAALTLVLALPAAAAPLYAQAAPEPELEILDVSHDPAGFLTVNLRAGGERGADLQRLTMFLDGTPIRLDLGDRATAEDLAVLLVIDTSGSMVGAWMAAARDAARALLERLSSGDRAGAISFDTEPRIISPLTDDLPAVAAAIDGLEASGWTALYDAVLTGVELLAAAPEERRVLVLLADGEDNYSSATAQESLAIAAASGVKIYTVGVGRLFDGSYLDSLSEQTGGEYFGIIEHDDTTALSALFRRLGGQLGSSETYTVPVRPLGTGLHRLDARATVGGTSLSTTAIFEVTNTGLLAPEVLPAAEPGEPIRIRLEPLVAPQDLAVEVRVGGTVFRPHLPSDGVVEADPWRLAPGTHDMEVVALVGRDVAWRELRRVEVPALAPSLSVSDRDGATVVQGRLQGGPSTLVAHSGGVEVGRSRSGELVLQPGGESITVELIDSGGTRVASHEIAPIAAAAARSDAAPPALAVLAVLAVAGIGAAITWLVRRRRGARAAPREALRRPALRSLGLTEEQPEPPPSARQDECFAVLIVRDQRGGRRDVLLTRRPITIGSARHCDVVLEDPGIRPQHTRITALSRTEVQIHAISDRGSRPYDGREEDEWLVLHHGEQVELGSHLIQVLMRDEMPHDDTEERPTRSAHAEAGA